MRHGRRPEASGMAPCPSLPASTRQFQAPARLRARRAARVRSPHRLPGRRHPPTRFPVEGSPFDRAPLASRRPPARFPVAGIPFARSLWPCCRPPRPRSRPHRTFVDSPSMTTSHVRAPRRSPLASTLALFLATPALAPPAPAANPVDFDAVVVTASGVEQTIVDAPASISVITREDLAQRPYITLLDAVRDLEGVDIGETRDKTGQGTISLRGMGADYTLILIDGRRQNNHGDIYPNNFGGNQFNHIPPLDAIERIEVIRGPMSTLYGADAMGGVINII